MDEQNVTVDSTNNDIQTVIRGYKIQRQVAKGGYGLIYCARQIFVDRDVAMKVIVPKYANQPEFIRRFESEAHLVARLEHPAIVPLYDYWRDPGGAYLIMRWLRGGTLGDALLEKPLSLETLIQVLEQVGAALAFAHKRNVVHRDLKPANILLDEEGNAYLADFGIAIDLCQTKLEDEEDEEEEDEDEIYGSPWYLSPEQLLGEPVTHQADIYSLGITIFELLTGRNPFEGLSPVEILNKHVYEPMDSVVALRPDLPEAVDTVMSKATAKFAEERYADVPSLLADLKQALGMSYPAKAYAVQQDTDRTHDLQSVENPYKGLRAFQEADANDFFGREAMLLRLLEHLSDTPDAPIDTPTHGTQQTYGHRFLAVVGPSGSGKSSLVRAGLVPALRKGALPGSSRWFIVQMTPGSNPLEELEHALLAVAVDSSYHPQNHLWQGTTCLVNRVNHILPDDGETELVLVIDQFEELFTLVQDEAVRTMLLRTLHNAVTAPTSRVRVIMTMRADFYDRPLLYPGFSDIMRQHTEVVVPLAPGELEQAIVRPAERVGVTVEPALIATISEEVSQQPGMLPLLEYALTELFERRTGPSLTLESYQQTGGILGALARRADALYDGFSNAEQEATRQLFLRLVNPGEGTQDTRRRVLYTELTCPVSCEGQSAATMAKTAATTNTAVMDHVIDTFCRYRLLTLDRDPATRSPTVEIAHEALIQRWKKLSVWLDTNRDSLYTHRRIQSAAMDWLNANRETSYLVTGARLAQFETVATDSTLLLNQEEMTFLQASIAEHRRREEEERANKERELLLQKQATNRMRYLVGVLGLFLIVAIGLSWVAFRWGESALGLWRIAEAQNIMRSDTDTELGALLSIYSARKHRMSNSEPEIIHASDEALLYASRLDYPQHTFNGHTDEVWSVDFSPDGRYVLTSSRDTTVRLWDRQGGELIRTFTGHNGPVLSAMFSPSGHHVLTASFDQTVRLWDVQTGAEVRRYLGHVSSVFRAIFSPNGAHIATCDNDGHVWLWDTETAKKVREYEGHEQVVLDIAFSHDGQYLLSGSGDQQVYLWDVETGRQLQQFVGHEKAIRSVAFSLDDASVLTAGFDQDIRLWDRETGELQHVFVGHKGTVYSAIFSPVGRYILSGSADQTVRIWLIDEGKIHRTYNAGGITSVAFSPSGNAILAGSLDTSARMWHMQAHAGPPSLEQHDEPVTQALFVPDTNYAVTLGMFGETPFLWDIRTGEQIGDCKSDTPGIMVMDVSPDGKLLATGGIDGTVKLWDVATQELLHSFSVHKDALEALSFSSDGTLLLSGSRDKTVQLCSVEDFEHPCLALHGHTGIVKDVALSGDNRYVLTGGDDMIARIWDVNEGTLLHLLTEHDGPVTHVSFSSDNAYALTGGSDEAVRLWNVQDGKLRHTLSTPSDVIKVMAFSPSGKYVFTGSATGKAQLWETQTGRAVRSFPPKKGAMGHEGALLTVTFSPDGQYILTGSRDMTARLWDVQTGEQLRYFSGHTGDVLTTAFSPDGTYVLTGSSDRSARLWYVDYRDAIKQLCEHLSRDFTPEEREKYEIGGDEATCP